jgi:hypothetical protein
MKPVTTSKPNKINIYLISYLISDCNVIFLLNDSTNVVSYVLFTSRDSSVGIATDYMLDDRGGPKFESQ